MAAREAYRQQVALLVRTLPFIADEACFALKGGTAINLFVRDLPRLSVDIDLTYLPVADWSSSLNDIDRAMNRITEAIASGIPGARVQQGTLAREQAVNKLVVRSGGVQIKVEVTPVLRGCVYEPEPRAVSPRVEEAFGFAEMQLVSFADLYAGKLVAALDRQHPRDLFDVRDLMANERISDELRTAFVVYLMSHNRPMGEVLRAIRKDISQEFERGFAGMTEVAVTLDELLDARERLVADIVGNMPQQHRAMLLSFERGAPDWSLLGIPGIERLPAIRWRVENLDSLTNEKRMALVDSLEAVFGETA